MLAKKYRLRLENDFRRVYRSKQSFSSPILKAKKSDNILGHIRVGIVVPKTISKKATERNKIKRQIRAIIEQEKGFFLKNADIVCIVKPAIRQASFAEIRHVVHTLFSKI